MAHVMSNEVMQPHAVKKVLVNDEHLTLWPVPH